MAATRLLLFLMTARLGENGYCQHIGIQMVDQYTSECMHSGDG